jgi:hypothetical protein
MIPYAMGIGTFSEGSPSRQKPGSIRWEELTSVLEDAGFEIRGDTGTSHRVARCKIKDRTWTLTLVYPHGKHVKQGYVKAVLKALDEIETYLEALAESKNEDEDAE